MTHVLDPASVALSIAAQVSNLLAVCSPAGRHLQRVLHLDH